MYFLCETILVPRFHKETWVCMVPPLEDSGRANPTKAKQFAFVPR